MRRSSRLRSNDTSKLPTNTTSIWRQKTDDSDENCEMLSPTAVMESNRRRNTSKKKAEDAYLEEQSTPRSNKRSVRVLKVLKKRDPRTDERNNSTEEENDEEKEKKSDSEVSPPKQARQVVLPKPLFSPVRLLDRLSIDCKPKESDSDYDSPSQVFNKYQNARRVLNSAETSSLPGREQQLQELRDFFTEHLRDKTSGSLYVSGQPGTGKTACLSLLLRAPQFAQLRRVYINCTSIASVAGIYKKICNDLKLNPSGHTARHYLGAIQEYLSKSTRMLLLVLDEIDQLHSVRQSVLYTIFEWPSLPNAHLLLVGIANSLDLTDRALQRLNARCELKPRLMHFPPYTKQQIVDIFTARLAEAGVLELFPPVTLQLLAAKVSAVSGDVRRALDIGRRVVEIAEQQKETSTNGKLNQDILETIKNQFDNNPELPLQPVQVKQVAAVLNKVYGASQNLQEDIESSFPLQQKLMLCTLMLMLRNERHKDITMGRMHEIYKRVCTKRKILALDQSEFAGLVGLVETRGILCIQRKKEPRLHKVQLQWDEDEVGAALSDKQLIASILTDTECLKK